MYGCVVRVAVQDWDFVAVSKNINAIVSNFVIRFYTYEIGWCYGRANIDCENLRLRIITSPPLD